MDSFRQLEETFSRFPGIGPRQAKRFVYYLLGKSPSYIKEFIQAVEDVKKSSSECLSCHRIFIIKEKGTWKKETGQGAVCSICSDTSRDQTALMVVARDSDFETVEKSGAYRGYYFILGGTVPILDKEPEKRIRLELLLQKISKIEGLKEVILSLNATPDGEHTADIVRDAVQRIFKGDTNDPANGSNGLKPKITILGRGLSTGAELEYVDGETIRNALKNRQ